MLLKGRYRTLGLAGLVALVAMLAISAVGALSASAEPGGTPEWGTCNKTASAWEFEDSLCNNEGTGEFFWHKITSPTAVNTEGTLELEDEGTGTKVRCTGEDKGTVGPGSTDEITEITKIVCVFVTTGLCNSTPAPTAVAVNLPWHTKLEVIGGVVRDVIVSGTGGNPGWAVTCTTFLGKTTDTCTKAGATTAIANVATGVDATFDGSTVNADCSVGGAGKGKVRGTDHILDPTGVVLSVK